MKGVYIRIPENVWKLIDTFVEGETATTRVKNFLSSPMVWKVFLNNQIGLTEKKLKSMKEVLKQNTLVETFFDISDQEKKFIIESNNIIKQDPHKLEGRTRLYNNTFKKKLSSQGFERLLILIK